MTTEPELFATITVSIKPKNGEKITQEAILQQLRLDMLNGAVQIEDELNDDEGTTWFIDDEFSRRDTSQEW